MLNPVDLLYPVANYGQLQAWRPLPGGVGAPAAFHAGSPSFKDSPPLLVRDPQCNRREEGQSEPVKQIAVGTLRSAPRAFAPPVVVSVAGVRVVSGVVLGNQVLRPRSVVGRGRKSVHLTSARDAILPILYGHID